MAGTPRNGTHGTARILGRRRWQRRRRRRLLATTVHRPTFRSSAVTEEAETHRVTGVTRAAGCRSLLYSVRWLDETAPNGITTAKPASQQVLSMCRWREQRVCVRNQSISQLMRTTRSLIKTRNTHGARQHRVPNTLQMALPGLPKHTRSAPARSSLLTTALNELSRSRSLARSPLSSNNPPRTHSHQNALYSSQNLARGTLSPLNEGVTHSLPFQRARFLLASAHTTTMALLFSEPPSLTRQFQVLPNRFHSHTQCTPIQASARRATKRLNHEPIYYKHNDDGERESACETIQVSSGSRERAPERIPWKNCVKR